MALNQIEETQDARELLKVDGYSSDFRVDLTLIRPSGQSGDAFLPLALAEEDTLVQQAGRRLQRPAKSKSP